MSAGINELFMVHRAFIGHYHLAPLVSQNVMAAKIFHSKYIQDEKDEVIFL